MYIAFVYSVKEEKKETPVTKNATDDVNGETKAIKASSIKSGDLSGERRRSKSSKSKDERRTNSKERGKPRTSVLTFAQIKVSRFVNILEVCEFVLFWLIILYLFIRRNVNGIG